MKHHILATIAITLLLSACANSASHEVVKVTSPSDAYLDCKDIRVAKANMNQIIDGVEQDKKDMTGADVVDGILWFPFNVIAKQANYTNSKKAATARLEHLTVLEHENGCKVKPKSKAASAPKKKAG